MQEAFLGEAKSFKGTPKLECCGVALTLGQTVPSMDGEACSSSKVDMRQDVRQAWSSGFELRALEICHQLVRTLITKADCCSDVHIQQQ